MELHAVVRTEAQAETREFDQLGNCRIFAMAIGDVTVSSNERWADSTVSLVAHLQHSMTEAVQWGRVTALACIDSKPLH